MVLKLKHRLPIYFIGLGVLCAVIVGGVADWRVQTALVERERTRIDLVRAEQAQLVGDVFVDAQQVIAGVMANDAVTYNYQSLMRGYSESKAEYMIEGFHGHAETPQQRALFDDQNLNGTFVFAHKDIHAQVLPHWLEHDVADIMMLDRKGRVVYTVTKGLDFWRTGEEAGGDAFTAFFDEVLESEQGTVLLSPQITYLGEEEGESFFIATPMKVIDGMTGRMKDLGVVMVRIDAADIDAAFAQNDARHGSASTALVGPSGNYVLSFSTSDGTSNPGAAPDFLTAGTIGDAPVAAEEEVIGIGPSFLTIQTVDAMGAPMVVATLISESDAIAPAVEMRLAVMIAMLS